MSQYGSNKVATVVLLDTSAGMEMDTPNGESYFVRSKWILERIVLRKIFAYETDEVGIITFGPEGVKIVSPLVVPSWDTFELISSIYPSSDSTPGNWAKGLVEAVNFLEDECQGKRFKSQQLFILSNFHWFSPSVHQKLSPLVDVINDKKLLLVVMGLDINKESQEDKELPKGVGAIVEIVSKLELGVTIGFEEVEEDVKYYEKKKKAKRLTKGMMKIGTQILLPFKWMKVTGDDTRLKFSSKRQQDPLYYESPSKKPKDDKQSEQNGTSSTKFDIAHAETSATVAGKTEKVLTANTYDYGALKFTQDETRKTRFGASEVLLNYADLECMKRKTGPPSLTFLGTVKCAVITRAMIVSPDVYVMVNDGTPRSQAQLTALITALLNNNRFGLARRVASKDGKVSLGILYPVSDEVGKALYFLKVPFAEWVTTVPARPLPDVVEPKLVSLVDELIDSMTIDEMGRDILVKDPNFQLRSFLVEQSYKNEQLKMPKLVSNLFNPHPELKEAGKVVVDKIFSAYPIPPPPPSDKPRAASKETPSKPKELTDVEKEELMDIQNHIKDNAESLTLLAEELYKDRIVVASQNTQDILDLLESQQSQS